MSPNFRFFLLAACVLVLTIWAMTGCAIQKPIEAGQAPGIIAIIGFGGCGGGYDGAVLVNKNGNTLVMESKQLPVDAAQKIADSLPDSQVEALHICSGGLETQR